MALRSSTSDSEARPFVDDPAADMGHFVVGVGYEADDNGAITKLIVNDPAMDTRQTKMMKPATAAVINLSAWKAGIRETGALDDILIASTDTQLQDGYIIDFDVGTTDVPEPASALLVFIGIALLVRRRLNTPVGPARTE